MKKSEENLALEILKKSEENLALEIFDRLYFGDSNILVFGEGRTLQEFSNGGVRLLKHKHLVDAVENFLVRFNDLAYEYTNGKRGKKKVVEK